MSNVAFAIEISLPNDFGFQAQGACNAIEDVFNHNHALRTSKAAECGLRSLVRVTDPTSGIERRDEIRVVAMEQRAPEHGVGEIDAPASIGIEFEFHTAQQAGVVEARGEL